MTKQGIHQNTRNAPPSVNLAMNGGGLVGKRTYSELAGASISSQINLPTPPSPSFSVIPLQADNDMETWIQKATFIGEALSLQHLGHLPTWLSIHNDKVEDVKYAGGMKVLLSFQSTVEARSFLENKKNWRDLFK